ncbi:hypothetical protein EDB87DRAFT_1241588 [Lactarius vividus]|nr:hypothetical protein EDB87DRAFT_1241588 [Lactarius vividus]
METSPRVVHSPARRPISPIPIYPGQRCFQRRCNHSLGTVMHLFTFTTLTSCASVRATKGILMGTLIYIHKSAWPKWPHNHRRMADLTNNSFGITFFIEPHSIAPSASQMSNPRTYTQINCLTPMTPVKDQARFRACISPRFPVEAFAFPMPAVMHTVSEP